MPAARSLALLSVGVLAAGLVAGAASAHRDPGSDNYRSAQAMSYELGSKRAIGYFISRNGQCQVTLMIAELVDPEVARPTSAARLNIAMVPGQSASIDSEEGATMVLTCGAGAETVNVLRRSVVRS
jgi:hypothetical protein